MKKREKKPLLPQLKEKTAPLMNRTAVLTVKGKSYTLKPVRLGVMVLVSLFLLVLLVQVLTIPARAPKTVEMELGAGSDYVAMANGRDLLMYNRQEIRQIDKKGNTIWRDAIAMSSPIAQMAGKYILVADLGGNHAVSVYKNGEKKLDQKLEDDIISADINQDGLYAVATDALGYKGKVTVYNKKGEEKFSWNSGEGYILDIALQENGRYLAVAQLISDGSEADCRIQFLDLKREKVTATAEKKGAVVNEIRFSGNRLITVLDEELCVIKTSGKEQFSVSFAGKNPEHYDISSDEVLAFVTTDGRGNRVLELYNLNGKMKGSYLSDNKINELAVHEDTVLISTRRDIIRVSPRGNAKKMVTCDADFQELGVFGDGKTAVGIGDTWVFLATMR